MGVKVLLSALALLALWFVVIWVIGLRRAAKRTGAVEQGSETGYCNPIQMVIGVVTDFFDTLGIGSYATTTALFKLLRQVPDRLIPGTLTVGHFLPTVLQAYIFTQAVKVDPTTLILMILGAVGGAYLGARYVAGFPRRAIQVGMGVALFVAATILCIRQFADVSSQTGTVGLTGTTLAIAVGCNFVLGAFMTIGVGLYAPCMILVSFLGMNTDTAFPIMMGSCAFLMPVAGARFISANSYSPRAALGLAIGGVPAVWFAAKLFKDMDLNSVKWLVVGIAACTSVAMLRSAYLSKRSVSA
ncbi:MAG: sulfite exporter TauE/SafE family protein [Planctomycetes bacterium]|nr:sulfite exporter TauE/SafE family protein [Planctomycetota bacterium]